MNGGLEYKEMMRRILPCNKCDCAHAVWYRDYLECDTLKTAVHRPEV